MDGVPGFSLGLHAIIVEDIVGDEVFMGFDEVTIKPIERLVPVSFTGRPASTPGLSTWWSTTALSEALF